MPALIPDYSTVAVLLPMSGADNGTLFPDYSPTPKAVTRGGNTKTVTAQSKYYGSSVSFGGAGDYLTLAHASVSTLFNADFSMGSWANLGASIPASTFPRLASKNGDTATGFVVFLHPTDGRVYFKSAGVAIASPASDLVVPGTWFHWMVIRSGSTVKIYVNGKVGGSMTLSGPVGGTDLLYIAYSIAPAAAYFVGHMQDFIAVPSALYAADFAPPGRLIGEIAVTTKNEAGVLVPRKVFAVPRSYPSVVKASGTTDASGALTLTNLPACEYSVVAIADGDTLPDLVMRKQAA